MSKTVESYNNYGHFGSFIAMDFDAYGMQPEWPDDLEKNRPIFWKVAKTVAKPTIAKIQIVFLNSLFRWKYKKL